MGRDRQAIRPLSWSRRWAGRWSRHRARRWRSRGAGTPGRVHAHVQDGISILNAEWRQGICAVLQQLSRVDQALVLGGDAGGGLHGDFQVGHLPVEVDAHRGGLAAAGGLQLHLDLRHVALSSVS
eukprot:scaffold510_cov242-Pinguiococcus_pyrenoidosus.AAC.20